MPVFDVTVPMHPAMPLWPGDPPFELEFVRTLAESGVANN